MFVISDFNIFPIMFLRQMNFGAFGNLQFLLVLSEIGFSPESCLAIFHLRASYLLTGSFF